MEQALAYTEQHTKDSKTNFYYSFLFLPKPKRDAIFTVYSFCRETDDIVDEEIPLEQARQNLDAWRREVDQCFAGNPKHPIMQALHHVIQEFPMPAEYFHKLIDGCEMDLTQKRYQTFDELENYCYHVASVVGLICIEIFGYRSPNTKEYAINLGKALQITNILRDVGEDAERGRIYLPLEDLERFGYSEADMLNQTKSDAFTELIRFEAQRAEQFYKNAQDLFEPKDHDLLFPAEIMRVIYYSLLQRIHAVNYNVFDRRVRISNFEKMRIALAHWLRSRWRVILPW
jgi:phytoene synthase